MSGAALRAARGVRERGRGRAGWVRRLPGRGARGPRGAGGGGRRSRGVFLSVLRAVGRSGGPGRGPLALPPGGRTPTLSARQRPQVFDGKGRLLTLASSSSSLVSSPALCCAAPAPHVLFGWVSNGGRGGSAAGLGLQGGQTSGPGQLLGANMGNISPSLT